MDFQIDAKPAKVNAPGAGKIYYSEVGDFATIATTPASPATQADKVTILDDHTFAGTDGFREMYGTDTKKGVTSTAFGGRDSGGVEVMVEVFFPGDSEAFNAFLLDDPDLILLVGKPDCSQASFEQIGTACNPAKIVKDHAYNSLKLGESDDRGTLFKVSAYQPSRLTYKGAVTLATA